MTLSEEGKQEKNLQKRKETVSLDLGGKRKVFLIILNHKDLLSSSSRRSSLFFFLLLANTHSTIHENIV